MDKQIQQQVAMEIEVNPKARKLCQNCKLYSRKTKLCSLKNKYTARKKSCTNFTK